MSDLREKLNKIVEDGKRAEIAIEKLDLIDKAESEDASIADLKAAVAVAEAEGDLETASILKQRWVGLLRGGAQ